MEKSMFFRPPGCVPCGEPGIPAKPGACVSPERAYYRQASQEALKKSAACITCPAARKRAPFIQDYLSGNRKVVNLFPLHSMLEAKAFLLSPALLGEGISRKLTKTRKKAPSGGKGLFPVKGSWRQRRWLQKAFTLPRKNIWAKRETVSKPG
ncbi:MAG: hypothetical protein ACLVKK_09530 [Ruthenibacterium sp.]